MVVEVLSIIVLMVLFTTSFPALNMSFSSSQGQWGSLPCFLMVAWCTSISVMVFFPKRAWDMLYWRQGHLQLGELPFLVLWTLCCFLIQYCNSVCVLSFDSFSLPKRTYFCLKNTAKLEKVGNFSDRYLDVAIASDLSETTVPCTLHGCVNTGIALFPVFATQSWLTALSVGGSLKCELSGMPVMWSLRGGPTGDRMLLRFNLLIEPWRLLCCHCGEWYFVSCV